MTSIGGWTVCLALQNNIACCPLYIYITENKEIFQIEPKSYNVKSWGSDLEIGYNKLA